MKILSKTIRHAHEHILSTHNGQLTTVSRNPQDIPSTNSSTAHQQTTNTKLPSYLQQEFQSYPNSSSNNTSTPTNPNHRTNTTPRTNAIHQLNIDPPTSISSRNSRNSRNSNQTNHTARRESTTRDIPGSKPSSLPKVDRSKKRIKNYP
jgi:hypothetical protein